LEISNGSNPLKVPFYPHTGPWFPYQTYPGKFSILLGILTSFLFSFSQLSCFSSFDLLVCLHLQWSCQYGSHAPECNAAPKPFYLNIQMQALLNYSTCKG